MCGGYDTGVDGRLQQHDIVSVGDIPHRVPGIEHYAGAALDKLIVDAAVGCGYHHDIGAAEQCLCQERLS